jgi:hypothetical protein
LTKRTKDIFQPRSSRVIRVLLTNPGKRWRILALAKEATVSLGWAHTVVTTLQAQGYIVRDESYQVNLVDPARLLRRWAAAHDFLTENRFEEFQTFERDLDSLLKRVKGLGVSYALTSLTGAWLVAPHVRPSTLDMYVLSKEHVKEIARVVDLRLVEKGGNVRLFSPYDVGVFYGSRAVDGINVVSNVQLYVDLVNYPARGEEASAILLKLIQDEWSKALGS